MFLPWNHNIDIYDALGSYAADIAPHVPDKYITNFPPIVEDVGAMLDIPRPYRIHIMWRRCGISLDIDTCRAMENNAMFTNILYRALTLPNVSKLISFSRIDLVLRSLDDKYHVLVNVPELAANYLHRLDDVLELYNFMKQYKIESVLEHAVKYTVNLDTILYPNNIFVLKLLACMGGKMKILLSACLEQLQIYSKGDICEYVLKNIDTYPDAVKYGKQLQLPYIGCKWPEKYTKSNIVRGTWKTDYNIISELKCILPYNNYPEHVKLSSLFSRQDMWFIPLSCDLSDGETSITMEDIRSSFMIGYGTKSQRTYYSWTEIREGFSDGTDERAMGFHLPNIPEQPQEDMLRQLLCLLRHYIPIEEYIILENKVNTYAHTLNTTLTQTTTLNKFMYNCALLGLYARRWKGPGNPYPYDKKSTLVRDVEPSINMTPIFMENRRYLQELSSENICMYTMKFDSQGGIRPIDNNFLGYYKKVEEGKECIRVASAKLLGTAKHYLGERLTGILHDLDWTRIEFMPYEA